jgi:hypothetical protein
MQSQMDTLGKFGWELVSIVGVIGGDQEMVFRRPYDPDQSKAEAALIREEGERLLAAQKDLAAELAQADFVDLDATERAAATTETRQKEEARLRAAIQGLNNSAIVDIRVVSTARAPEGSDVTAEVVVDGSSQLLKDGNKYRASEALTLAKQIALEIYNAAGLKQGYSFMTPASGFYGGEVKVSVSIRVSKQGKQKIVATANVGGQWPERKRS